MSRESVDAQGTAVAGRAHLRKELEDRGARVTEVREGTLLYFELDGPNGQPRRRVRVKTRTSGTWQTSTTEGLIDPPHPPVPTWWAFVDLSVTPARIYIADDRAVRQNIWAHHGEYLQRHGDRRPISEHSTHHAISLARVECLSLGWAALGLGAYPPGA